LDESRLRPDAIPAAVVPLLPLAERWGIGDDYDRAAAVDAASRSDLEELVLAVDTTDDQALYGWLAGPESFSPEPSLEYIAVTCLTMAADQARLRLRQG
jgi:hypothetical protein